jgi:hypothetical protein
MTANAGYKAYATGDVLTAAQVQYNLQNQTVMYFATSAARTTALTGVTVEGMVTYIPANGLEYYNGSAWITLSTGGDITGVTAGTGITGGGTSGTVTVTNDMATTITTAGDLIKGTGSGTYARLGIGSTGQVLTVSGGAPVWATAASSSKFGQLVSTFKSDSFTAAANNSWTDVTGMSVSITPTATTSKILVQVAMYGDGNFGDSSAAWQLLRGSTAIGIGDANGSQVQANAGSYSAGTNSVNSISIVYLDSPSTTSSTTYKIQGRALGGSNIYVNRSKGDSNSNAYARYASSITVTEILA